MNVLPVEIEKKISKCKYVKECAVIGEPNFYFGNYKGNNSSEKL